MLQELERTVQMGYQGGDDSPIKRRWPLAQMDAGQIVCLQFTILLGWNIRCRTVYLHGVSLFVSRGPSLSRMTKPLTKLRQPPSPWI